MNIIREFKLCLVTDRALSLGRSLPDIVSAAVAGGVDCVQLREKNASTREFLEIARQVKPSLEGTGVPLIINDRADIALAVRAEGLHIGQSDLPCREARMLMGTDAIIGLSVENSLQAREANDCNLDYIGLSPVFGTMTKTDTAAPLGLEGIKELTAICRHRAIAIGGINEMNARDVIRAGASGLAIVSAICSAPGPENAARGIMEQIRRAAHE